MQPVRDETVTVSESDPQKPQLQVDLPRVEVEAPTLEKVRVQSNYFFFIYYLEAEGLFPAVRIFLDLFPRAGYFFNAFD